MSIKNLKPKKDAKTKQGYFSIKESSKYIGIGPVIYRSSWEHRFCIWAEKNPKIVKWSSESIKIQYWNPVDHKWSTYYPDFYIELENGSKFLIEVKPRSLFQKPSPPKIKRKSSIKSYKYAKDQYMKNISKMEAALKFCESKGWKYRIADESWFNIK